MEVTRTPNANPPQLRTRKAARVMLLFAYCYTILATPFLLAHFTLDILLALFPWTRPIKGWSLNQAARMRVVRLVLLYWSRLRWGDRLTLKPGGERNRFEVMRPGSPKLYTGALSDSVIQPETIGTTWTPARPPPPALIRPELTVVLHFHGGGFAIGNGRDEDTGYLARTLIQHMGCKIVCTPQYRLSSGSNGRFPAPVQDALTAYLWLLHEKGIPAHQIVFSGDSAGGNIALGLLRYIHEHGAELDIPAPAAVALWSPWGDVAAAINQDMRQSPNYKTDYLNKEFGYWGATSVSGNIDPSGPYLSPLHHTFRPPMAGMPMFLHGGDREVLWDDIQALAERYGDIGWKVHLAVSKQCPHDILLLGSRLGFEKEAEEAAKEARNTSAKAQVSLTRYTPEFHHLLTQLPGFCYTAMANGIPGGRPDNGMFFDTIIIGAGISGINAAYRIQTEGPADTTYAILEGRDSIGGTWDLFRYPGIRSDSDIFTFGFPWSPWKHNVSLASADQIKTYMRQSAASQGIDQHILYRHSVASANWSSANKNWELQVEVRGQDQPITIRSRFLLLGTGYYDYEKPLQAVIPGIENFAGRVIHPQFWPEDYDYTGKKVVIIGSGATAVTVLPAMAEKAKQVTMLQRSPGYVFSLPSNSIITALLFAILPISVAHYLNRIIWLFRSHLTTVICRTWPGLAKLIIKYVTIKQLPPDIPWDPNFKPRYNPWEQRFCACVDGDFFAALRSGKGNVVTGTIKTVTEKTIELDSGERLHPDLIVTATGLKLRFGGGIRFAVDGRPFEWSEKFAWRAAMLEDVPNLLFLTGYETASWTLGADVSARLFVRILREMQHRKATVAVPRPSRSMPDKPMMTLNSTYLKTVREVLPKAGTGVWAAKTNYFADMARAKWGSVSTDLEFS
ncbi:hypothetical protein B0I37DRAFT_345149 [Chaetomium sp. MPI-CAGE-AT-0009]|nr:hypothetical protein B0I37DRAFT_345149 [Chaetomium sp. MPI-CAGE-AT-0009]